MFTYNLELTPEEIMNFKLKNILPYPKYMHKYHSSIAKVPDARLVSRIPLRP